MTGEAEKMLTLPEVAERLRLSRRTVQRMLLDKSLVGVKVGRGRGQWRFKESDIERLLSGGRHAARSDEQ